MNNLKYFLKRVHVNIINIFQNLSDVGQCATSHACYCDEAVETHGISMYESIDFCDPGATPWDDFLEEQNNPKIDVEDKVDLDTTVAKAIYEIFRNALKDLTNDIEARQNELDDDDFDLIDEDYFEGGLGI